MGWSSLGAAIVGGAVGTALRLLFDALIPQPPGAIPVVTVVVNIVGSGVLGLLVGRLWGRVPEWARVGLGPGLLGSFTTFSAVAVTTVELVAAGSDAVAALYFGVSLIGGLAAAALGIRWGARGGRLADVGSDE